MIPNAPKNYDDIRFEIEQREVILTAAANLLLQQRLKLDQHLRRQRRLHELSLRLREQKKNKKKPVVPTVVRPVRFVRHVIGEIGETKSPTFRTRRQALFAGNIGNRWDNIIKAFEEHHNGN